MASSALTFVPAIHGGGRPSCDDPPCRISFDESGDDEEEQSDEDDHDPRQGVDGGAWVKCGRVAISAAQNVDASQFGMKLN